MPAPSKRVGWPLPALAYQLVAAATIYAFFVLVPDYIRPRWPQVVEFCGSDYNLVTNGVTAVHMCVLIVGNAFFALLYWLRIPFFEQFKISPKPWGFTVPGARADSTWALIKYSFALTLFNNFAIALPLSYFNYNLVKKMGFSVAPEAFPSSGELLLSLAAFMVIEDAIFYVSHRTLHSSQTIYANIHKLHHRYYQSLSFAAEFAHPVEFMVGNAIPFALPPMLFGAHGYTWLAWTVWRISETIYGHSGYDFPWAPWDIIPFAGGSAGHDAHHALNSGNFSSFFVWWDKVFGTEIPEEVLERNVYSKVPSAAAANGSAAVANGSKEE